MGTAVKHAVPNRVKQSFEFLTPGHSDAQGWLSSREVRSSHPVTILLGSNLGPVCLLTLPPQPSQLQETGSIRTGPI